MKKVLQLLVFVFLLFSVNTYAQNTIYVNATATGGNDGTSWTNGFTDFQAGVNAAAPGDVVFVAKGSYRPASGQSFSMKGGVKIYGGFAGTESSLNERNLAGGDSSILKGNGASVIRNLNNGLDSTSLLDGFKITGGHPGGMTTTDGSGGGILNRAVSPTFSHLTITGNIASMGGGMFNFEAAAPILTDVTITGNTAATGGGMQNLTASPVLTNVSITSNTAESSGGGMFNGNTSDPVLTNVLISNNKVTAGYGGAMTNYNKAAPSLTNVTITGNTASVRGGGMHNYVKSSPILTNCIVWGNSALNGQDVWNSDATLALHYSLYANGADNIVENAGSSTAVDGHSLIVNPQFADAANGNYQLLTSSPAINAGINDSVNAYDTTDLLGNSRIFNKAFGGIVDMGAYEYQGPLHPDINGIIYVDSAAAPGGDGSSWTSALRQLADALKAAQQINATTMGLVKGIWITSGTYYPLYAPVATADNGSAVSERDKTFMLVKDVTIYGGFKGTETSPGQRSPVTGKGTVLSGDIGIKGDVSDNAYHVVMGLGNGTFDIFAGLGNVTITGGNANGPTSVTVNGTQALQRQGGGLYMGQVNLAIANCLFTKNSASKKGGAIMNVLGAPSVSNSSFIINCTFADNTDDAGKAIYNYQTPTPILIMNSIVMGGIQYEGAIPVINFSLVEGMPADPVNYNLDGNTNPQFVDGSAGNYQLASNSPAINAGNNSIIDPSDNPVDLIGNARIFDISGGGIVDMGAFEYANSTLPVKMSALNGTIDKVHHVKLSWNTFTEINNKGFQIQYSTDGVNFENGSFVPSKAPGGNSSMLLNYAADAGFTAGVEYYRLAQTNIDSKITYSNVIHLEAENTNFSISTYPNPVHSFVNIHINGEQPQNGRIMIVGMSGRILRLQNVTSTDSKINLSGLSAGIYILKYTDGKYNSTIKIIKK